MTLHYATFERFYFLLSESDALSGSHMGACDEDINALLEMEHIKAQFEEVTPDDIRAELKEYGAWDEAELSDDEANRHRILWIACGNVRDEMTEMQRLKDAGEFD
jgi:hypothetical protein